MKNRIRYRNKCVLLIQKVVRGYLARKQHRPRVQGVAKINNIRSSATKTVDIAKQLKDGKEGIINEVYCIEAQIDDAIKTIKVSL